MRISDWSSDVCSSDLLEPFPDRGDTLATADAHGRQTVSASGALKLENELGRDDRTGGADGMPKGDSAAIRIHLGRIEAEITRNRTRLRRECLVRLDHVEICDSQAGATHGIGCGRYGHAPHIGRDDAIGRAGGGERGGPPGSTSG